MMTKQEYVESLRKLNMVVYMFGERIESAADHPVIRPSIILWRRHTSWPVTPNMKT